MNPSTESTEVINSINEGSVIDHIPENRGLVIVRLLKLDTHKKRISIGLNLPSTHLGHKDIIKIEERELSPEEANQVALFAPEATISIIRNHEVVKKFQVSLPKIIVDCAPCPNPCCITNHEGIKSTFLVSEHHLYTQLSCHYCRKIFTQDEITI